MIDEPIQGLDSIARALEIWVDITGVDPNTKSWATTNEWEIRHINEELKESLKLDPSKITTMMMLDYFVRDYLTNRTFSVLSILEEYDLLTDYLEKSRELLNILNSEEVTEAKQTFKNSVIASLQHYGVTNEETFALASDLHALGFLRRDALRSIDSLECHQFLQGASDDTHPVYFDMVYEFWNINSLIRSMTQIPKSGITLNLIRDPHETSSFFVFGIRNGGTVSILTDRDKEAYPLAKFKQRRPDRSLAARKWRHHFPYDLMGLEFSEGGRSAYIIHKESQAVAPYQSTSHPMKKISLLNPDEIIWISMMFSQIDLKFWKQGYKTKELSYTGDMLQNNDILISAASNLPVRKDTYQPLLSVPLTNLDLTYDSRFKEDWGGGFSDKNRWMEERYQHKLDDPSLFNLMDDNTESALLYTSNTEKAVSGILGRRTLEGKYKISVHGDMRILRVSRARLNNLPFFDRDKLDSTIPSLQVMDSTFFGSADEVVANQRWSGRYNKAKLIEQAALEEYHERKDKIKDWFEKAITSNMEFLLNSIATGKLEVSEQESKVNSIGILSLFSKFTDNKFMSRINSSCLNDLVIHATKEKYPSKYLCPINGRPATIFAKFAPRDANDLALMCGCKLSELPDVLRFWRMNRSSFQNSFSSRVDPMESSITNPWEKIDFDVLFHLSKSGYIQLCKKNGQTPHRFWIEEERKYNAD